MGRKNGALLSVCSNTLLIILKIIAGIAMGSVSVISEAIHSSIDLIASIIAYFSIREASKEPDREHPFGHGKYESVSGFVEALLILLAGILIVIQALKKLTSNAAIESVDTVIIVMLIGSAVNFIISRMLLRIAKKEHSIALEADAMHLLTDVLTSAGVMFGLILIKLTGLVMLDAISALVVAILITKTSIKLIKESLVDLVDTKLSDEDIQKIVNIINSCREVKLYHKLRTRKVGNAADIDVHVMLNSNVLFEDAHKLCDDIENSIRKEFPGAYVVIHAEPYTEDHNKSSMHYIQR
jgi:cation diffusion facilitator family transporter